MYLQLCSRGARKGQLLIPCPTLHPFLRDHLHAATGS